MTNDDLDLVPMDDLLDALRRRTDAFVLVTTKMSSDTESDDELRWGGSLMTAIGLLEWGKARALASFEEPPETGEGI